MPRPGKEFFVPRSPTFSANAFSVQMLSRSDADTEVFSKLNVNGAGGLRTYLSFHAFGVLVNIVELPHVEYLGKSRFRIGDLKDESPGVVQ
jgi:hypothetical protein